MLFSHALDLQEVGICAEVQSHRGREDQLDRAPAPLTGQQLVTSDTTPYQDHPSGLSCRSRGIIDLIVENEEGQLLEYLPKQDNKT